MGGVPASPEAAAVLRAILLLTTVNPPPRFHRYVLPRHRRGVAGMSSSYRKLGIHIIVTADLSKR